MDAIDWACFVDSVISYHEEIRGALFISGFTIGSFLLSMKTFIIKTMKEEFYDVDSYQESIFQRRKLGQKVDFYGPLKRFSNLLSIAILTSFFSSVSQITIGFSGDVSLVVFCLLLAFLSWVVLIIAIYYVSLNWKKSLELSENKAIENEKDWLNK